MGLRHPYQALSDAALRRAVVAGAGISAVLGVGVLWAIEAGPGMEELAALVLAGTTERATAVLETWSARDRTLIGFVAGFDFLFGVAWTNAMALGCIWVARQPHASGPAWLGPLLAWSLWLAMLLDVPENLAYLAMVLGSVEAPWPATALLAVAGRIVIFVAAVAFLCVGAGRMLLRRQGLEDA